MDAAIAALKAVFDAAIVVGEALDGIVEVGIYDTDMQGRKDLVFPLILIGQGPEQIAPNTGNKRVCATAALQVTVVLAQGKRNWREAIAEARVWGRKAAGVITADPTLGASVISTRIKTRTPALLDFGGTACAQANLDLEVRYSEYPS